MVKRTGGAAFPRPASEYTKSGTLEDGNDAIGAQDGMSLRDWFAGQALGSLHGQIADIFTNTLRIPDSEADKGDVDYAMRRAFALAETAYFIADCMIAERAK